MKKLIAAALGVVLLAVGGFVVWKKYGSRPDPMVAARNFLSHGDLRAASVELRAALRDNPDNAEAHMRLGFVSLQLGDAIAAEKELTTAKTMGFKAPDIDVLLAQSYLLQGRNKELLATFQPPGATPDLTSQLLMIRALASASLGDTASALVALNTAETLSPNLASVPLTTARLAIGQNNLALADQEVQRALQIDPHRPDGLLLQAQISNARGNRTSALASLDAALQASPSFVAALLERANILLTLGEDAKAKADVDKVLAAQPNSAAATYLQAVLLVRAHDDKAADEVFQKLSTVMSRFPRANFFSALAKYNLGQQAQALDLTQRYVARNPNDPDGVKLLARIQLANNRPEQAIAALTSANKTGITDSEILDLLSQAYTAAGKPANAAAIQARSIETAPQSVQSLTRIATASLGDQTPSGSANLRDTLRLTPSIANPDEKAVLDALSRGEVEEASKALDTLRSEEGDSENVGLYTGALLAMRQQFDGARKQFEHLIEVNPQSLRPHLALAQLQMMQGQTDAAEQTLAAVLAQNPADSSALSAVLPVLVSSGRVPRAMALLEAAYSADPKNTKIVGTLAEFYIRTGAADKALKMLDSAVPPDGVMSGGLLLIRAHALVALRRTAEAMATYNQVLQNAPGDVGVVRELVAVETSEKNWAAARDSLHQALQSRPNDKVLLRLLVGVDLADKGEAAAFEAIEKLRADPATAEASRALRADLLVYTKHFLEGAEAYAALYKEKPEVETLVGASNAYLAAGQTLSATSLLEDWVGKGNKDPEPIRVLSSLELSDGNLDKAQALLEELLTILPGDSVGMNNLAWIYDQKSDPRALALARRAFLLLPGPQSADTLGWILLRKGETASALPLLTQASAVLKTDPAVQYHYAAALKAAGKAKEALAVAQPLADQVEAFPDQPAVRKMVEELRQAQ